MSSKEVKAALEQRLKMLPNSLPTQWENVGFTQPNSAYQRADLLPAEPDNPTLGDSMYREQGVFQVMILAPINGGAGVVYAWADALRDWFKRGTSLASGDATVRILRTPRIGPKFVDGDRFCLPVSIRYSADFFS